ncbi:MAG: tRNA pseudouridine(38-40) synthase TruA [Clostridia bacterium]|nr:tRNA pseudouridine(38-40) synthase TruA [Clostridia bacterium]
MKYRIRVAFDGRDFSGYQFQPGRRTVQGELTKAAETLFGECSVTGCSRTDAGVHATGFVASIETVSGSVPADKLPLAMNSLLPEDIAVTDASVAPGGFHPRYDAKGKHYRYLISDSRLRDPLLRGRAWQIHTPLDVDLMNESAQILVGEHDFAAFCAAGAAVKSTVRTIFDIKVRREGGAVTVDVYGNGFLYNMVRIIVGTLVYVSQGKLTDDDIRKLLETGDRTAAGITAPPDGLYLAEVYY